MNLNKRKKFANTEKTKIDNGIKLSVDLSLSKIIGYVAKKNTPVLNF